MAEITVLCAPIMELENFKYTANFCEENIWHLCQNPDLAAYAKTVLILSNSSRNCPLWQQKSAIGQEPVRWDYHVILLVGPPEKSLIYDFDSTLHLPSPLDVYLNLTFRPDSSSWEEDKPFFKAIEAADYIRYFYSDRGHMIDGEGDWKFTPPSWPLIKNKGELPLPELLDFSETSKQKIYRFEEVMAMGMQI